MKRALTILAVFVAVSANAAPITDPTAIRFANERIRPMADQLLRAYYQSKLLINDWNAQGMAQRIPNREDLIMDGHDRDGRSPITGAQATNIIVRAMEYVESMEADNNAKLNTLSAVAVNH